MNYIAIRAWGLLGIIALVFFASSSSPQEDKKR